MTPRRRTPHASVSRLDVLWGVFGASLLLLLISFSVHDATRWTGDTENVVVQLRVIDAEEASAGSSSISSSASSSESSSVSSSVSSISSSISSRETSGPDGGEDGGNAYRYDPGRILDIIAFWRRPRHAAAPSSCADLPYEDVLAKDWFAKPAHAYRARGILDKTCLFYPHRAATRAETVKMQSLMRSLPLTREPSSFDDIPDASWLTPYAQATARAGWLRGIGDCYGKRPCMAAPEKTISRAEASALIVRMFAFERTGKAPRFPDNTAGPWYAREIQIAADHCVLLGDGAGRARPNDDVTRSELVMMLWRAEQSTPETCRPLVLRLRVE